MRVLSFGENKVCGNRDAIMPLARFELILIIIAKFERELKFEINSSMKYEQSLSIRLLNSVQLKSSSFDAFNVDEIFISIHSIT